jgi:pimeloyl-ACP methyl ester carboxylesterase
MLKNKVMVWFLSATFFSLFCLLGFTHIRVYLIEKKNPPEGQFVQIDDLKIHYVEKGEGIPVILLHGVSSTLNDFTYSPVFEELSKRARVIVPDRPGYGYSERPRKAISPADQASILEKLLNRLKAKNPIIVGFSWSGSIAAAYGLKFPESTSGLVFINGATYPWPAPVDWIYKAGVKPFLGPTIANFLFAPIGALVLDKNIEEVFWPKSPPENYKKIPIELIFRPKQFYANAEDMIVLKPFLAEQSKNYSKIKAPVSILVSEEDIIVSPTIHSQALNEAVVNSKLTSIPNAGHPLHHSHPQEVTKVILEILDLVKARN